MDFPHRCGAGGIYSAFSLECADGPAWSFTHTDSSPFRAGSMKPGVIDRTRTRTVHPSDLVSVELRPSSKSGPESRLRMAVIDLSGPPGSHKNCGGV